MTTGVTTGVPTSVTSAAALDGYATVTDLCADPELWTSLCDAVLDSVPTGTATLPDP